MQGLRLAHRDDGFWGRWAEALGVQFRHPVDRVDDEPIWLRSSGFPLDKTETRSLPHGVVTQLAMSMGRPAGQVILNPAMTIVPDRFEDVPPCVTAGFSQVARAAVYGGMSVKSACDSNTNIMFCNAVLPVRVAFVPPAIAFGKIVPGGSFLEPNRGMVRGSMAVFSK